MTKFLANKFCLPRTMVEKRTNFNKNLDDLENIKVKLQETLLLLNALLKVFKHFKNILLFGKEQTIT